MQSSQLVLSKKEAVPQSTKYTKLSRVFTLNNLHFILKDLFMHVCICSFIAQFYHTFKLIWEIHRGVFHQQGPAIS